MNQEKQVSKKLVEEQVSRISTRNSNISIILTYIGFPMAIVGAIGITQDPSNSAALMLNSVGIIFSAFAAGMESGAVMAKCSWSNFWSQSEKTPLVPAGNPAYTV